MLNVTKLLCIYAELYKFMGNVQQVEGLHYSSRVSVLILSSEYCTIGMFEFYMFFLYVGFSMFSGFFTPPELMPVVGLAATT